MDVCDLSAACLCGEWLVLDKSDAGSLSVGRMKGSEDLTTPTGGVCVGVTLTGANVSSCLSSVFAIRRASNLLNLSDHLRSNSSILESAEDL